MVKLNVLVKTLREVKEAATREFQGDARYRPGHELARAEAKATLPKLEVEFTKGFKDVGFPVFVESNLTLLANLASQEAEVVSLDFSQAYTELTDQVRASIGASKTFGPGQFSMLVRTLRQLAAENGIASIPTVEFNDPVVIDSDKSLRAVVASYVNKMTQMALTSTILTNQAVKEAIKLNLEASVVPVFVFNATKEEAEKVGPSLFKGKFLWLNPAEDDVNLKYINNLLQQIKKLSKSKE